MSRRVCWGVLCILLFYFSFLVFVRGMSSGVFALIISTSKLVTYMKSHSDIIQVHNEPEI